jgi:PAS domain S-box-containing protein
MRPDQAFEQGQPDLTFLGLEIAWTALNFGVIYWLFPRNWVDLVWIWVALLPWAVGLAGLIYSARRSKHYQGREERAHASLQENEILFRNLVEMSPNAIIVHENQKITFINQRGLKMIGASRPDQVLGKPMLELIHPDSREIVSRRIAGMLTSGQMAEPLEEKALGLDGRAIEVEVTAAPLTFQGRQVIQVVWEDISERKRLQRALESIEKGVSATIGRAFFESAASQLAKALESEVVFIGRYLPGLEMVQTLCVFQDGKFSPNFEYPLAGAPCENVINQSVCCYPNRVADLFPEDPGLRQLGAEGYLGMPLWNSAHEPTGIIVALYRRPIVDPEFAKSLVQIFASRVQTEIERNQILNELQASRAVLETTFNAIPYEIWATDSQGLCILQNPVSREYWGENLGKNARDLDLISSELQEEWAETNRRTLAGEIVQTTKIVEINGKSLYLKKTMVPVRVGEQITGLVGLNIDVTNYVQAEKKIRSNMERLAALRELDQIILNGSDLHAVMDSVCKQIISQLKVDAGEILQLDSVTFTLEILARQGLQAYSLFSHFPASEDIAARAVLERATIYERNFSTYLAAFPACAALAAEQFRTYIAVPLVAKGTVRGVLEIFHHADLQPDPEWWDLVQSLANQAAIAIDNLALSQDLQRSHAELSLAYDLTLEGWSKALEIRDQETEGHTQRVTSLTLRLSEALGVPRSQLVQIRRGALLHDIGKMGIPDRILHKPGPLNAEEWTIVRQHPQIAYELLLPIPFLRHALEIPYCHHEHWDGTGYPRGLKGLEIPLAARIFSVIDVWDALTNDRPYRKAESPAAALAYLREQKKRYFDPEIVEVFDKLVGTGRLRA